MGDVLIKIFQLLTGVLAVTYMAHVSFVLAFGNCQMSDSWSLFWKPTDRLERCMSRFFVHPWKYGPKDRRRGRGERKQKKLRVLIKANLFICNQLPWGLIQFLNLTANILFWPHTDVCMFVGACVSHCSGMRANVCVLLVCVFWGSPGFRGEG